VLVSDQDFKKTRLLIDMKEYERWGVKRGILNTFFVGETQLHVTPEYFKFLKKVTFFTPLKRKKPR
jgi:hypothetical protein